MKGKSLPSALGVVALLLVLTCVGGAQESQDLVNNKDVYVTLSYDDEISYKYKEEAPQEIPLSIDLETKLIDVVFVIDVSGTMAAGDVPFGSSYFSRLQVVKRAINAYIMNVIDEKSHIKLVTFGEEINVSEWQTKNDTIKSIEGLIEGGQLSRGADALFKAIDEILHHEKRAVLVLFTDGVVPDSSWGTHPYLDVKSFAAENGIEINTVIIGFDKIPETDKTEDLEDLASETNGFFHHIKNASQIEDIEMYFQEKYFSNLENVIISLQPMEDIEIIGTAAEELGTVLRGDRKTLLFNLMVNKPRENIKQTLATLAISYGSKYGPYQEEFDIEASLKVQTMVEYYLELVNNTLRAYKYYIVGGIISLVTLLLLIRHLWISHKRTGWIRQGDDLFRQGDQEFSMKKYEDASPLYEKALGFFKMAKSTQKQNFCERRIKECKGLLTRWIQKSSELEKILEEIEAKKNQLRTLVGYEPPGRMYDWLFAKIPSIKPLFGMENLITKAREHIKERNLTEIDADILVLDEKLRNMKELVSTCESTKKEYLNNRAALNENLAQFYRIDVSYIGKFCNISQRDALYYLNFLIDENLGTCVDYDRNHYAEIRRVENIEISEVAKEKPKSTKKIEQNIYFISHYLEEDASGIEKIDILRRMLNISEEEMASLLEVLKEESDEDRYYIDWYEEKIVVDYFTLKDYFYNAFRRGQAISDIIQMPVNKCGIPEEIQRRIITDSQDW